MPSSSGPTRRRRLPRSTRSGRVRRRCSPSTRRTSRRCRPSRSTRCSAAGRRHRRNTSTTARSTTRSSPPRSNQRSRRGMLLSRALLKRHSVLPGFDLALGFTLLYLSFIVLVPLSAAFLKTFTMTWPAFWDAVTAPRVVASYRLTFGASFAAALVNAVFGLIVCWVLVRYDFPARRFVDALVDLPFALPTAVAGIALTSL